MERPSPEFRLLRYFLAVARERNVTRAAVRLNMAQPPLSQQIAALEHMLGCQLFIRRPRGVELTDAARALVPRAEALLRAVDDTVRDVQEVSDGMAGVIRVAAVPTAAAALVAPAFASFRRKRPRVVLLLQETTSTGAITAVTQGDADLAVVRGPVSSRDVACAVLLREEFVLVVCDDHPLGARREPVLMADLASESFVLFDIDSRMPLHAAVLSACLRAGFSPTIACEGAELMTIGRLVEAGVGVALLPETTATLLDGMRIRRLPIGAPAPVTTLDVVWAPDRPAPAVARSFREVLEGIAAERRSVLAAASDP